MQIFCRVQHVPASSREEDVGGFSVFHRSWLFALAPIEAAVRPTFQKLVTQCGGGVSWWSCPLLKVTSGLQYMVNFLKEQHIKCCGAGKGISWYLYFTCLFVKRIKYTFLSHWMQAALQIDFGPCHEVNAQLDLHWHENTICITPACLAGRREDTGLSSWSQLLWENIRLQTKFGSSHIWQKYYNYITCILQRNLRKLNGSSAHMLRLSHEKHQEKHKLFLFQNCTGK